MATFVGLGILASILVVIGLVVWFMPSMSIDIGAVFGPPLDRE